MSTVVLVNTEPYSAVSMPLTRHFTPAGDSQRPDDHLVAVAIDRTKAGDANALHFLYVRYAEQVYRYVCSVVTDTHEAEDITQNVFARLFTSIQRYEPKNVPFSAWIMRVARNAAVDQMRSRRALPAEDVRASDEGREQSETDRMLTLRDALDELPADQREVVLLRHVAGLSPGEIAQRLNRSEGSIHGLHHRGRGALRHSLAGLGAAPSITGS